MAAMRIDEQITVGATEFRLARLPPIGFWSYSRQDDELSKGKLSNLRGLLMSEIQQQYGRDRVQLFQDVGAIPHGAKWEREIRNALENSTFFIPIITPNFIQSEWCCQEVTIFLEREERLLEAYPDLPRRSRIFPIQLIDITDADAHDPHVLTALAQLQWFDFRRMRHQSLDDEPVQRALSEFARSIRELLYARVGPAGTKEDREREAAEAAARARKGEAAAAERARQEDERSQREVEEADARADAEQHALAARTEGAPAPLVRRIALGAIPAAVLLIGGVWLWSPGGEDRPKVEAAPVRQAVSSGGSTLGQGSYPSPTTTPTPTQYSSVPTVRGLVGTWSDTCPDSRDSITFTADGRFTLDDGAGTWTVDGSTVTLSGSGPPIVTRWEMLSPTEARVTVVATGEIDAVRRCS